MRASRESLASLGRRLPQLAAELERLADSLEAGKTGTLDDIRRLLHDVVTGMCVEEKVQVPGGGLATTTAMLDVLRIPAAIAQPLRAIESGELTLTGDATRAVITLLEWRVGSRPRQARRRSRRGLVIGLVAAIAVVVAISIAIVVRRDRAALVAADMVTIQGATYTMGTTSEEQRAVLELCRADALLECTADDLLDEQLREVTISTFEIDRHEVTTGELVQWLDRERPRGVTGLPYVEHGADGHCSVKPEYERLPATGVTWEVARAYCEAVGKRLPTEAEWELAARGVERRRYPWGAGRPACDEVVFGRRVAMPCEAGFPQEQPASVETATRDVTPEGVHDLGGNVSEWTSDAAGERPRCSGPCVDPRGTHDATRRVVRGGHFRLLPSQLRGAARYSLEPDRSRTHVGFRCVRAASPSS